jgi:Tol biopolymer transport system component
LAFAIGFVAAAALLALSGPSSQTSSVAPSTRPSPHIPSNGPIIYLKSIRLGLVPYDSKERVFLMAPDGTDRRLLLDGGGFYFTFAPSPDGVSILFNRFDSTAGPGHLFLIRSDGRGLREILRCQLTDCIGDMAWSPDGTDIAVIRRFELILMRLDISTTRTLVDLRSTCPPTAPPSCRHWFGPPAWSPDGTTLAAAWETNARQGGIDLVDVVSGAVRQLVLCTSDLCRRGARPAFPSWSPDGTEIVFTREFGLFAIHPDGTALRSLGSCRACGASPLTWSPDGTMIAVPGEEGINLLDSEGGFIRQVGPNGASLRAWMPAPPRPADR